MPKPIDTTVRWRSVVKYGQFVVHAFELEPGKWRARIWRADGAAIVITGRRKLRRFITGLDARSASAAMVVAMKAIDSGTFLAHREHIEKFWRFQNRAANDPVRDIREKSPGAKRKRPTGEFRMNDRKRSLEETLD
jgi:hypothetical protein